MDLYPAIDLRGGRCVRLHQGDYSLETVYDDDPVARAVAFADAGALWIHVVDLDAARSGNPVNRGIVEAIASAVPVPVQTGGGVRSVRAAEALFESGVERVVVGTAALTDPDLVSTLAVEHRVAVGLDARSGKIATDGWTTESGRTVLDVARSFADVGVDAFVVTDITRDGTMEGPDLVGLGEMLRVSGVDVIASGGIGSVDDLRSVAALEVLGRSVEGVIVGKAIYEGRLTVAEALTAIGGARP